MRCQRSLYIVCSFAYAACGGGDNAPKDPDAETSLNERPTAGADAGPGEAGAGGQGGTGGHAAGSGGHVAAGQDTSTLSLALERCLDQRAIALDPAGSLRELARSIAIIQAQCSPDDADLQALTRRLGKNL